MAAEKQDEQNPRFGDVGSLAGEADGSAAGGAGEPLDAVGSGVMRCRRCSYDLRGLIEGLSERDADRLDEADVGRFDDGAWPAREFERLGGDDDEAGGLPCPECGLPFDPDDPETYDTSDGRTLAAFTLKKGLPWALVITAVVAAVVLSWIPLPAPLSPAYGIDDWRTWVWFDDFYGWEARTLENDVFWWAGETRGVRRFEVVTDASGSRRGDEQWSIIRDGDEWTFELLAEGVAWREVLPAWNATRDRLFGLMQRGEPTKTPEPFTFTGGEAAFLTEMIKRWGLDIQAATPRGDPDRVWVWHPGEERVIEVAVDDAAAIIGYDPRDPSDPSHPEHNRRRGIALPGIVPR